MIRLLAIVLIALTSGCAIEIAGKSRAFAIDMGIHPPTNAVIAVSFTKVGIVAGQNPATQVPEFTIGYVRGTYYRIPVMSNGVPVVSADMTVEAGLNGKITETFSTGK